MTESEIIKALEHCTSSATSGACNGCPLNTKDGCNSLTYTYNLLEKLALDLINRKNAEIERLQKHNTEMARKHYQDGRAEAIKEFAERIKSVFVIDERFIDQIAKEMGVEL